MVKGQGEGLGWRMVRCQELLCSRSIYGSNRREQILNFQGVRQGCHCWYNQLSCCHLICADDARPGKPNKTPKCLFSTTQARGRKRGGLNGYHQCQGMSNANGRDYSWGICDIQYEIGHPKIFRVCKTVSFGKPYEAIDNRQGQRGTRRSRYNNIRRSSRNLSRLLTRAKGFDL
jgi:hypothetical protein